MLVHNILTACCHNLQIKFGAKGYKQQGESLYEDEESVSNEASKSARAMWMDRQDSHQADVTAFPFPAEASGEDKYQRESQTSLIQITNPTSGDNLNNNRGSLYDAMTGSVGPEKPAPTRPCRSNVEEEAFQTEEEREQQKIEDAADDHFHTSTFLSHVRDEFNFVCDNQDPTLELMPAAIHPESVVVQFTRPDLYRFFFSTSPIPYILVSSLGLSFLSGALVSSRRRGHPHGTPSSAACTRHRLDPNSLRVNGWLPPSHVQLSRLSTPSPHLSLLARDCDGQSLPALIATRNNSYPLTTARLTPSASREYVYVSWRTVVPQLSAWETRCCECSFACQCHVSIPPRCMAALLCRPRATGSRSRTSTT